MSCRFGGGGASERINPCAAVLGVLYSVLQWMLVVVVVVVQ